MTELPPEPERHPETNEPWLRWLVGVVVVAAIGGVVALSVRESSDGPQGTSGSVMPNATVPASSGPPASPPGPTTEAATTTTTTTTLPEVSARAVDSSIWITADELDVLPVSGPAWDALRTDATGDWGTADLGDQDNDHDAKVLAGALYGARVDDPEILARVDAALDEMTGTLSNEILAVSRNLTGYVLAADIVGYRTSEFEQWVADVVDHEGTSRAGIGTLRESAERDPSNHGAHARTAVLAVALYLGDDDLVTTIASRFHDWLGRTDVGFEWRERYWQADPDEPRGINPVGATIDGLDVDGVLPEEQRRSGPFTVPPPKEGYVWEALQGAVATAELLQRQGFATWRWENEALKRAFRWLHDVNEFPAEGDDTWQPWLVNARTGSDFPAPTPSQHGKSIGYTDWTHGSTPLTDPTGEPTVPGS